MEFHNLSKSEEYKVIINEPESIWLKNTRTGEILPFEKERLIKISDAFKKFGNVPVIHSNKNFYVLDLKIKPMELVLDCTLTNLEKIKDPIKKSIVNDLLEKNKIDSENGEFVLQIIWHRNLIEPFYIDVSPKKDLLKALDSLRKVRNRIKTSVRATIYHPLKEETKEKILRKRSKMTKQWGV